MKKITLLVAALFVVLTSFAQTSVRDFQYDSRVYQLITPNEFELLKAQAPDKLLDLHFDLTHYATVTQTLPENCIVKDDICNYTANGVACNPSEMISTKKFTRHYFSVSADTDKYTAYPIGETGYYVVVLPSTEFVKQKRAFFKKFGY